MQGTDWFVTRGADAKAMELDEARVGTLREEEMAKLEEKLRKTREREAAMAEESDDEIVFSDEEDD